MKKKAAIFTIVKDEYYFLPKWIKYYSQFFDKNDMFILDHETKDGSTTGLGVNVKLISNGLAFDHLWLVEQVQSFQSELLQQYEVVVFTEVDEILYGLNEPLDKLIDGFIKDENKKFLTSIGYEIRQDIGNEKPLLLDDNIMQYRDYWFRYTSYDKTLITKVPLKYGFGFHECNYTKSFDNLYMLHLHRVDLDIMIDRRSKRATQWNLKQDDIQKGFGSYHAEGERDRIIYYMNHYHDGRPIEATIIPKEHKDSIYGL